MSFFAHSDMKIHVGSAFTMVNWSIISWSAKQKRSGRSSTESEINDADYRSSNIVWAKKFVENQGCHVKLNVMFQNNTITKSFLENGKESSGKRTLHFYIRLFCITYLIVADEVVVKHCPTDKMVADCISKPLVGSKFKFFRNVILNLSGKHHSQVGKQCCLARRNKLWRKWWGPLSEVKRCIALAP